MPPAPAGPPPPHAAAAEAALRRVPELEAEVSALKAELADFRGEARARGKALEARLGEAASREELKKTDFKLGYLNSLIEGLKRSLGGAGDLLIEPAAAAEKSAALENEVAALRDALAAQGEALRAGLAAAPQAAELSKISVRLAGLESALEKAQKAAPPPAPPAAAPAAPAQPGPAAEAAGPLKDRLDASDKALAALRAELAALKEAKLSVPPPAAEPPPASALSKLFGGAAAEAALAKAASLEGQFSVLRKDFQVQIRKSLEGAASREDLKEAELRLSGLSASLDALKKIIAAPAANAAKSHQAAAGTPPPPPAAKPEAPPPPKPEPVQQVNAASKEDLERAEKKIAGLAESLERLGRASAEAPVPPPAASPAALQALGAELAAARAELATQREWLKSGLELAANKEELKKRDFRIGELAASFESLKESFASAYDLAARLKAAEEGLAGLRAAFEERGAALERKLNLLAGRAELAPLLAEFGAMKDAFASMNASAAALTSEFGAVADECRRALGEVRGHAKTIERRIVAGGLEEHLRASVERLSARLAEAEAALHAGFADMGGRLTASETLYRKMFSDAEGSLRKAVEPELRSLDGSLRTLREKVLWLTDEYDVVMKRKIRALEGKYSVLELIERRMGEKEGS